MDLSKAFNTLNDDLLIAKLLVYGFSEVLLKLYLLISLTNDKEQRFVAVPVLRLRSYRASVKVLFYNLFLITFI